MREFAPCGKREPGGRFTQPRGPPFSRSLYMISISLDLIQTAYFCVSSYFVPFRPSIKFPFRPPSPTRKGALALGVFHNLPMALSAPHGKRSFTAGWLVGSNVIFDDRVTVRIRKIVPRIQSYRCRKGVVFMFCSFGPPARLMIFSWRQTRRAKYSNLH